jgi:hypothetical protein
MDLSLLAATLGFVIRISGKGEEEADLLEKNLEYMAEQDLTPPDVKEQLEFMLDAKDKIENKTDQEFWELMSEDCLRSLALPPISALSTDINLEETSWQHPNSFLDKKDFEELKEMIRTAHTREDKGLEEVIVEEKARNVHSPADLEEVKRLYRMFVTRERPRRT